MSSITREKVEEIFKQDENGAYLNLVIPATNDEPELTLTGKRNSDLIFDEIFRAKQYASKLYSMVQKY